ncbi:tetratricopeptide repeat protein [Lyngbya confervoides]|uniref:Tetratricopeptide repeat protein n=1 Tax=Lyngbya confervoides BDU141951 TaxID=1574623 RepID=A0ABD4SZA4_9CYAN|nr:tetratricopeptide repeat protein [Lyngbya confervoides]MCM1981634.1 tetratricopeptide repeat protein [Lyngbya confervoides BDU141951]
MKDHPHSPLTIHQWRIQDLSGCQLTPQGQLIRQVEQVQAIQSVAQNRSGISSPRNLTAQETAHLRAAYFWLNQYQHSHPSSVKEQVKGLMEGVYALEQLKAWTWLCELLFYVPANGSYPLYQQLELWGLVHEQVQLFQALLGQVDAQMDMLCLRGLGNAHTYLSQYSQAVHFFEGCLHIAQAQRNVQAITQALEGLGFCYLYWGKYELAQELFLKQLQSAVELLDADNSDEIAYGSGRAMAGLAYSSYFLRRYRKGIHYAAQSMMRSQEHSDTQSQWMALGAMAICYSQMGKHAQASQCLQQRLTLKNQGVNRHDELINLIDLGATYCYQLQFHKAIQALEQVTLEAQELGNVRVQCQAAMLLGFIYCWQDEAQLSIEKSQFGLQLAHQFKYDHFESQCYSQLSYVYSGLGDSQQALFLATQALKAAEHVSFQPALYKACGLMALGLAKIQSCQVLSGFSSILASLIQIPPWSAADGRIIFALLIKRAFKWVGIR